MVGNPHWNTPWNGHLEGEQPYLEDLKEHGCEPLTKWDDPSSDHHDDITEMESVSTKGIFNSVWQDMVSYISTGEFISMFFPEIHWMEIDAIITLRTWIFPFKHIVFQTGNPTLN